MIFLKLYNIFIVKIYYIYNIIVIFLNKKYNKIMKKSIMRMQLDDKLSSLKNSMTKTSAINKKWIKTIRTVLGMTSTQLAKRLNVSQARVSDIEKGELEGRITLRTLKEVANAMECEFVYAIVPKKSLNDTVRKQAEKLAVKRMNRVNITMSLEQQGLPEQKQQVLTERLINDLEESKHIWDVRY